MNKRIARTVKWVAVSLAVSLLAFLLGHFTVDQLTAHGVHPAGVAILFVFVVASFIGLISTVNAVSLLHKDSTRRTPVNVGITVLGAAYIAALLVWIYSTSFE